MATTLSKSGNDFVLLQEILKKMGHRSVEDLRKRCWFSNNATPACSTASRLETPVQAGDLVYATDDDIHICTVTPTANTAGAFTEIVNTP